MKSPSSLSLTIRRTFVVTLVAAVTLLQVTECSGENFLRASNNNSNKRELLKGSKRIENPNELSAATKTIGLRNIVNGIKEEDISFFNEYLEDLNSFPTAAPTNPPPAATNQPTESPTDKPSNRPTESPTDNPTDEPIDKPTDEPTDKPTNSPTDTPTKSPTDTPTKSPTDAPSEKPTDTPSEAPTDTPTVAPTEDPTEAPILPADTKSPTVSPTTKAPSRAPVVAPTTPPAPTTSPVTPTLPTPSPVVPLPAPTPAPVTPTGTPSFSNGCNLSSEGRVALINIFLRVVSDAIDMDTPGSPQVRALEWIINDDPMQLCPQDPHLIQRYVLAVFYFSTRGDRWIQCSAPETEEYSEDDIQEANDMCTIEVESSSSGTGSVESGSNAWLTPETECSWGGLACNENNDVVRIEMEQNGVAGTLPHELSRLQNLRNLVLEEGILTGTIPKELGEIQTLEQIDLNFNLLQGSIPEELYNLENLRQMDLNDNELTGTISENIGNLLQMSFFQIENNLFTGMVPSQMGSLVQLEVATMDNNQLSGTMPCTSIADLSFLQVLTADCLGAPNRPSPPLVICECCTQCF